MRQHQLGLRDVFDAVDAVFAKVVGADVGDDRHIGLLHRQAPAQDAAACGFQQRHAYSRVAQHQARAGWAGVVAFGDGAAGHLDTFSAAQTWR